MSSACNILIVDDDPLCRRGLERGLRLDKHQVLTAGSVAEARVMLAERGADVAFLDFNLGDGTGAELLRWARSKGLIRAAFCVTGMPTCANVVDAMQAGFIDVVEKPYDLERIRALVRAWGPRPVTDLDGWRARYAPGIIGHAPALLEALQVIEGIADTDCGVLITGESGTGKELLAQALHRASARSDRPFRALNCAAIPESLIEAELFGHAKGAFTGALSARTGHIAAADGGTLFLDEIGDLPLAAQAKLLRVLQEKTITPVGSDHPVPVDVRVVAATHRDLEQMVEDGQFRTDLYFRLYVVRVQLPALRERPEDILPLAEAFLVQATQRTRRAVTGFDDSARAALLRHPWPGNVRELANAVERAVLIRREGMIIERDLQLPRARTTPLSPPAAVTATVAPAGLIATDATHADLNLRAALDDVERNLVREALDRSGGNRTEAAALLGLNRTTLVEKLRRLA